MPTVSIISPWHEHAELIPGYADCVEGADEVIIVDNGSSAPVIEALRKAAAEHGWKLIENATNAGFSEANNQGLAIATGDIVVFMNNDVERRGQWLHAVRERVRGINAYGASLLLRHVDREAVPYLEGWCLIMLRATANQLGGWNADAFPGFYYEDNEFCWRVMRNGGALIELQLPLIHLGNYTTSKNPKLYERSEPNRKVFEEIVRNARANTIDLHI